ncbi:hypothetical protein B0J18DRAFT_455111 [Chaetomium sp. MPI-SDFR-AT-0129]|nr:hypothetical protein B0J18DRAFT_455111 [Chaetomium sp. MPI-SDFR-AT-0129]
MATNTAIDTPATTPTVDTDSSKSTFQRLIPFDLDTSSITQTAAEFLKPKTLTPFLDEHKSGIIISLLWLSLIPLPFFLTFTTVLVALALAFPILHTLPRTLTGLAHHAHARISSSLTSLNNRVLPPWILSRVLPIALLFPVLRAVKLLLALAAWEIVQTYRVGVTDAAGGADKAACRVGAAVAKAEGDSLREVRGLERVAM